MSAPTRSAPLDGYPGWAPEHYDRTDCNVFTERDVQWLDRMWELTDQPTRIADPWLSVMVMR